MTVQCVRDFIVIDRFFINRVEYKTWTKCNRWKVNVGHVNFALISDNNYLIIVIALKEMEHQSC